MEKKDRAKYRIIVLEDLDSHAWKESEYFVPVLSMVDLRFLVNLVVKNKFTPMEDDARQAFCQAYLSDNKSCVYRPPDGCKMKPPNSYLPLKDTIYGLKYSPRHWYKLTKKMLISLRSTQYSHSPFIFHGTHIPYKSLLDLGLYVDKIFYFSASPVAESQFETEFSNKIKV